MSVTTLKILNTVTALGADLVFNTDGTIALSTLPTFKSVAVRSIMNTAPVVEVKEVWTITPTAAGIYTYQLTIVGVSKTTGLPLAVNLSYVSDASGTATEICNGFRTQLANFTDLNVVGSGTTTLVLTASGITPTSPFSQLATFEVASTDGNLALVNTTDGVPSLGLAYQLADKYPLPLRNADSGYASIADLVAGSYYAEIAISYEVSAGTGSPNFRDPIHTNTIVCLVLTGTTATPTTANYATLVSTWGTIAQLAAGYKSTIVAVGANVAYASSIATRASGSFVTEQLRPQDQIAISDGAVTSTNGLATVIAPYTDGTTAANFIFADATIDNSNTVTAGAAFVIHRVNLQL